MAMLECKLRRNLRSTTNKGIPMTAIDIGVVFARSLAVLLILSVLNDYDSLYEAAQLLSIGLFETAFLWAESVAKICLAIVLWFLPRTSAAIVVPASIAEKTIGELNASAIEQAAFGFLGLYLIVWGITDLLYHAFIVIASNNYEAIVHAKAGLVATGIQLLMGGWLFFGKGSPYDSVRKLRQA